MTPSLATDQRDDVKALVLTLTDVCNRHDPDQAATFYAEDAEVINHGSGQHLVGRTAIREDLAGLMAASPDLRIEKTHLMTSGNTFADEFLWTGTHTGDLPGLPATGRQFRVAWAGFGEIRDGKIVRHVFYWNMTSFLTQLGVLAAPEGNPGPPADRRPDGPVSSED
jgi:steroid delta-isomerase-like uncharacterized protein